MERRAIREQATKGVHLALRQIAASPELIAARRLSRSLPTPNNAAGQRILIMSMRDWAVHVHLESLLGHALELRRRRQRGSDVLRLSGARVKRCDRDP